ncbi:MAG: TonB-dependent receptor [Roseivirga sp.]|nr:TonB-dependent receptor [Roseivirga sp.]
MRSIITMLLLLCCYAQSSGQERTISGQLTDSSGLPLPQVTILIKGTTIGTATDADGNYSIKVPIGATLVFRYLGFATREVVVTEDNLKPARSTGKASKKRKKEKKPSPISQSLYQDAIPENQPGVARLGPQSPTYRVNGNLSIPNLKSIRKLGNTYRLRMYPHYYDKAVFGLEFSTSFTLDKVFRLPTLQQSFAQGRAVNGNLIWRGPETGELFSWGPEIRSLSFDGSDYPYDQNGRLIPGAGGKPASSYNPQSFFRTGYTTSNELIMSVPGPGNSRVLVDIGHKAQQGVIPNADYRKTNLSLDLEGYKLSQQLSLRASFDYNHSNGRLLSRGANIASIVGSVYRTPTTFDNTNGLSTKSALVNPGSYELANGGPRTHAPGEADNPFGLASTVPDEDKADRLLSALQFSYAPDGPFNFLLQANVDHQKNQSAFGIAPGYSGFTVGRLTERDNRQTFTNASLTSNYEHNAWPGQLKLSLTFQSQWLSQELNRIDGLDFTQTETFDDILGASEIDFTDERLNRNTHEILVNAQYEFRDWLRAKLTNRTYFSSTVDYGQFSNFFPLASLNIGLSDLLNLYDMELNIYTSFGRSIRESPLVYNNWSYGSTVIPVQGYNSFYESGELFSNTPLAPETGLQFETGLDFNLHYALSFEFAYFNNQTNDFVAPAVSNGNFGLSNLATVRNKGFTVGLGYQTYRSTFNWSTKLNWSAYTSRVESLDQAFDKVALAGFTNVQTVLAKGESLGAIYGSTYLRNGSGQRLIGPDGFPLKDSDLKKIGDPIPDWLLGWSSDFRFKNLKLSLVVDFKQGGDMWNGTNSSLDYLGRSSTTGELRNTTNHIFSGVTSNGQVNTTPVSFYDPSQPLSDNRWVRYGWDGVAEDYIEDASWIRLSEVSLTYTLVRRNKSIREMTFSLTGRNLFLITPYGGSDPASTLFGYTTGNGLDLFNAPSTRSYSLQVSIKL